MQKHNKGYCRQDRFKILFIQEGSFGTTHHPMEHRILNLHYVTSFASTAVKQLTTLTSCKHLCQIRCLGEVT